MQDPVMQDLHWRMLQLEEQEKRDDLEEMREWHKNGDCHELPHCVFCDYGFPIDITYEEIKENA